MSVIGIDLGNLNCVIAQAQRGGVDVILNEASLRQTASYVSIQGKQRYMGDAAANMARSNLKQTYASLKRLIGRKFDEPEVQEELRNQAFDAIKLPNGGVGVRAVYNDEDVVFSVEQLQAMLLLKLKQIAEAANNGVAVADCVLSVPTWYTDAQRRALLDAAEIAGVNVLTLLNESTAIALSYGIYKSAKQLFDKETPTHVMFVDMGHSAYTVSVVSFIIGQLTIRSAVADRNLGGRDFDNVIVAHLVEEFKKRSGIDVSQNYKSILKLQSAAEKVKKSLSPVGVGESVVNVECLHEDIDFSYILKREKLEELCAPLVARLDGPIQQALRESGVGASELAHVEILGGGTRVEAVKRILGQLLGLDSSKTNFGLNTTLNADEASARGCALQCAILSSRFLVKPFSILDAVSYPIKVSWEQGMTNEADEEDEEGDHVTARGNSVVIFERNADTPKVRRVTFPKCETCQLSAQYDESAIDLLPPGTDLHLANFTATIPPNVSASSRVRFNLRHTRGGMIELASAQLMEEVPEETGKEAEGKEAEGKDGEAVQKKRKFKKVELKVDAAYNYGLSRAEIQQAIEREANMAQQDRILRETAEKRNDLEAYIYGMRTKLGSSLNAFVLAADRARFDEALNEAENWLYSDEGFDTTKTAYTQKLDALLAVGNPIESRLWESENRGQAVAELQSSLDHFRAFVASQDERYAHISDEDKRTVRDEIATTEGWLFDLLEAQGQLPQSANAVLTVASLRAKQRRLQDVCQPIMNKPKPVPKKEEKPAAAEAPATQEVPMEEANRADEQPADEVPMDEEIA